MQKPFKNFKLWLTGTALAGAVALIALAPSQKNSNNSHLKRNNEPNITEAYTDSRQSEKINTAPFNESQGNQQANEVYKGPQELTDFLTKHRFSASHPDAFLATAGVQFRELFDLNRHVWEWAKTNGYDVSLTETEARIQENFSWPMGYLKLELGAGTSYETRIMNSQLSTEIETPQIRLKYTHDTRKGEKADFYQCEMTDRKRKEALIKGEQLPDKLYALSFVFFNPNSNWSNTTCYGGHWNPDPRVKETEKQTPVYTQMERPDYGVTDSEFRIIQDSAKENLNLFKSQFPNTTKHIK